MPLLDVNDLLTDADLADTFAVKCETEAVSSGGMNQVSTTTTSNLRGVVYPVNSATLLRLPEAERISGQIIIVTPFLLTTGSGTTGADIVTWRGRDYTVCEVNDFSGFGAGFIEARAKLLSPSP